MTESQYVGSLRAYPAKCEALAKVPVPFGERVRPVIDFNRQMMKARQGATPWLVNDENAILRREIRRSAVWLRGINSVSLRKRGPGMTSCRLSIGRLPSGMPKSKTRDDKAVARTWTCGLTTTVCTYTSVAPQGQRVAPAAATSPPPAPHSRPYKSPGPRRPPRPLAAGPRIPATNIPLLLAPLRRALAEGRRARAGESGRWWESEEGRKGMPCYQKEVSDNRNREEAKMAEKPQAIMEP
ncbi:hypothetical protein BOTBODRAFT_47578 [Botryobasidium botryosum FD-172 SS1]|uniref:Uncharacterized protein n=1 Tax=Botryobasidium botryosum (strain FD-172 SS1) TaxID=930990 RepID=A0A067MCW5_BOTB1|nr:hypothetical protein BOTBODRAFT_47578 [Botryobasidium botryosum FD-172 SS1]